MIKGNVKKDYVTFDVKIGDKVKFYIEVAQQNIGTTGKKKQVQLLKLILQLLKQKMKKEKNIIFLKHGIKVLLIYLLF